MKRFGVCLSVFVMALFFLSISALAETPNRLEITSATVDLESGTIDIYGLNFGDDPEVWLENNESPLEVETSSDTQIYIAFLPGDIQPGTYRLMVARQGFESSHPEKADSLDVTIGTVGPKGEQGLPGVCDCPITQEQLDELTARLEYLENNAILSRFTDMGDGTIRDNDTGLIWLKNANCFGSKSWQDAMDAAEGLADGTCGLTDESEAGDWRLPTTEEWKAFMSPLYDNPALVNTGGIAQWKEGDAFTGVQSQYHWSSTEYNSYVAWRVSMYNGQVGNSNKGYRYYVWPVRSDN